MCSSQRALKELQQYLSIVNTSQLTRPTLCITHALLIVLKVSYIQHCLLLMLVVLKSKVEFDFVPKDHIVITVNSIILNIAYLNC